MGTVVEYVQNIWPFSAFVQNDLRASDRIVNKLPVPESTKHFVYAIRDHKSQAVIYILSVQNLSERSAIDAECLIRKIKPDAVIVQVGNLNSSDSNGLQNDKTNSEKCESGDDCTVPTSSLAVLKRCFMHKINREKYEDIAGGLVLKEIFGVGFNGHFAAAKKAAEESGSSFFILESPFVKCSTSEDQETEVSKLGSGLISVFGLHMSNLVPARIGSSISSVNLNAFRVTDDVQFRMVKSLSPYLFNSNPVLKPVNKIVEPMIDYEAPQFAKTVYSLLVDLHDIFVDIPSMKTALACAQKMLESVGKGENVDTRILSEVYVFQIAVEGLRIALNNASRIPLERIKNPDLSNCKFSDLPMEDKSHAILAQAIQSQTKKYKSVVAIVDASGLSGLRKHWKTSVPTEVKETVEQLITRIGDENDTSENYNKTRLLTDKPVVAVGAGATAILGATSLSKVLPASSFIKMATFHVPSSIQLVLTQTQKAILFALSKGLGPTKAVMGPSTLKSSAVKAAASAEKIRVVVHSVIASAEKTSLSAMRTAFYEIMRKRRVRPVGFLPWATFGCSIATCGGLLAYGDGIECVAESVPAAPSIASLGRGIESLRLASMVVKKEESFRIQNSIEALLCKFKNIKIKN